MSRAAPGRGRFLVLEGGEGSGKTTALEVVGAALQGRGHEVVQTREPGGTPEGSALRTLLLAEDGPDWDAGAELLLLVAARAQHVRRVILPALAAGRTVLCDRFVGSTLAYQGAGRGLEPALILDLHRRFACDLWPDLTILLDVDPAIGLARSARRLARARSGEGRFEALDLDFHRRVRAAFLAAVPLRPTAVIDAGSSLDEVRSALVEAIDSQLDPAPPGDAAHPEGGRPA